MGCRANILVMENSGKSGIFLYTHWLGRRLPLLLKDALKRCLDTEKGVTGRYRLTQDGYIARIIFSEMIRNHLMSNTDFGFSTYLIDNEFPIIIYDTSISQPRIFLSFAGHTNELIDIYYRRSDSLTVDQFLRMKMDPNDPWAQFKKRCKFKDPYQEEDRNTLQK